MSRSKIAGYLILLLLSFDGAGSAALADASQWQPLLVEGDKALNQQKLFTAEACYDRALTEIQKTPYSYDDLVKCLEKLAAVTALEDKTDEAVTLYKRILKILERRYGKDSERIVPTLFSIGSIYESVGDPRQAMRLYQRALAIKA